MAGIGMKYWKVVLVMLVLLAACCGQVASQSIYAWLAALLTGGQSASGVSPIEFSATPRVAGRVPGGEGAVDAAGPPPLSEGVYNFGARFMEGLRGVSPNANVVFSPVSLMTSLSLVYFGSMGSTRELMENTLDFQRGEIPEALIGKSDVTSGNSIVNTANRAFFESGLPVLNSYISRIGSANVDYAPFSKNSRSAVRKINRFVNDETQGLIPEIVTIDLITELTQMVLVNAVYFKGTWLTQFDEENTKKLEFRGVDGPISVDFMTHKNALSLRHGEVPELDSLVVEIPYSGNGHSMYIVLPNTDDGWKNVEFSLATTTPNFFSNAVQLREPVLLTLPKWEIETSVDDTKEILTKMGLGELFSASADLTGIIESNLQLSEVVHKAKIIVSEEGTEAAAATAVVATRSAQTPPPPKEILVNHPFLFYILDKGDGSILFQGTITNLK